MANITVAQIEDAILAAIRADSELALVTQGGYSKMIENYAGEFELDKVEDIILLFPAIFVVFVQADYQPSTNEETNTKPMFTILVADENLRGNLEARRGGVVGIGTYRMMEDIRNLLQGNDLGIEGLGPLQIVRQVSVVNNPSMSIYAMEFETDHCVTTVTTT